VDKDRRSVVSSPPQVTLSGGGSRQLRAVFSGSRVSFQLCEQTPDLYEAGRLVPRHRTLLSLVPSPELERFFFGCLINTPSYADGPVCWRCDDELVIHLRAGRAAVCPACFHRRGPMLQIEALARTTPKAIYGGPTQ
jgi:hypothetical protein